MNALHGSADFEVWSNTYQQHWLWATPSTSRLLCVHAMCSIAFEWIFKVNQTHKSSAHHLLSSHSNCVQAFGLSVWRPNGNGMTKHCLVDVQRVLHMFAPQSVALSDSSWACVVKEVATSGRSRIIWLVQHAAVHVCVVTVVSIHPCMYGRI